MMRTVLCLMTMAPLGMSAMQTAQAADSQFVPKGELAERIRMVSERMLHGEVPAFTDDFVLADVVLDPAYPRRFSNYSGDLSGRYIGAFAMSPLPSEGTQLAERVATALKYQKPDGRFGSEKLNYAPEEIGLDHMALLWGNGRLLVGLLEYLTVDQDPKVLDAAKKLGDFLLTVHQGCADEGVVERVKDLGAAGMICFSQLNEGLVMLGQATGDARYFEGARQAGEWLPRERAQQHSHGYLTTLRGMVMLSEATGDTEPLTLAEKLYNELTASADNQIYGGIQEYFGGKGIRDEGCSEADFLRLALQLWKATDKSEYLDQAERCILNQFYQNQFSNGDFGHHVFFEDGVAPYQGVGRAWWCCTMHGLRAFRDIGDSAVREADDLLAVDLFVDGAWASDDGKGLSLAWNSDPAAKYHYFIEVDEAPAEGITLAVRQPSWVRGLKLTVNGEASASAPEKGFVRIGRPLAKGDRIEVVFDFAARLVKRDGSVISPDALTDAPVEAVLFYGPWIVGVDEPTNLQFFGEPWASNKVLLPADLSAKSMHVNGLELPMAHVACEYEHDGFPGRYALVLRPMSERTMHDPLTFAAYLNYRKAD